MRERTKLLKMIEVRQEHPKQSHSSLKAPLSEVP